MAQGRIVAKTGIDKKNGFLYYVDANGNVRETKMSRGGKAKRVVKRVNKCSSDEAKLKMIKAKAKAKPKAKAKAKPKKKTTLKAKSKKKLRM